ncbi:AtpZ/AtpI family protein [Rhodobacter sp. 24-YEA-8]|uniref:AtpZ/AtpI family protein n=1 Tax=Rhodobacter sp. 24-YEA-8 TaxID=1884310 RepID=UPI00089BEA32|nr:AtpZ/AtpI family protein [Rhodobacter sp. 24-YEA-8]SEC31359.1 ATP synthase protein I [Rhodobacter sp. 24-YEA-8]
MASEPDPDRLRALEKRLGDLRGRPKSDKTSVAKGLSHGELAWRMVIELATGIMVGTGIGYGLDKLFGTLPFLLVIFSLLGFAAGVRTMMGTAREVAEKRAAEAARDDKAARAEAGAASGEGN